MKRSKYRAKLKQQGLKITPQRVAVMEAIGQLDNHPSAENILSYIKAGNPNISTATVYKVLDAFVNHNILKKIETEGDIMRYDKETESHHHLYCPETGEIKDYFDNGLSEMIEKYIKSKEIPGFEAEEIKVQLKGKFVAK